MLTSPTLTLTIVFRYILTAHQCGRPLISHLTDGHDSPSVSHSRSQPHITGLHSSGGGDGGDVNFRPLLRTLAKGAAATLVGIFSITMISSTAITLFTLHKKDKYGSSSSMMKKNASSCDACRGKGFYMCKLCKGNATIEWSPLYDPVFINPCLCPTCDGHRIQRCLNCLGSGFAQQAKG